VTRLELATSGLTGVPNRYVFARRVVTPTAILVYVKNRQDCAHVVARPRIERADFGPWGVVLERTVGAAMSTQPHPGARRRRRGWLRRVFEALWNVPPERRSA